MRNPSVFSLTHVINLSSPLLPSYPPRYLLSLLGLCHPTQGQPPAWMPSSPRLRQPTTGFLHLSQALSPVPACSHQDPFPHSPWIVIIYKAVPPHGHWGLLHLSFSSLSALTAYVRVFPGGQPHHLPWALTPSTHWVGPRWIPSSPCSGETRLPFFII